MPKPSPVSSLKPLITELRICKDIEAAAKSDLEWVEHRFHALKADLRQATKAREVAEFALAEAIDAMTRSTIADELTT